MIYDGMIMMHFYVGALSHANAGFCSAFGVGEMDMGKCPLDQHLTHGYVLVKSMVCSGSWMSHQ